MSACIPPKDRHKGGTVLIGRASSCCAIGSADLAGLVTYLVGCETTKSASCEGFPLAAPPQMSMVQPSPVAAVPIDSRGRHTHEGPSQSSQGKCYHHGDGGGCSKDSSQPKHCPGKIAYCLDSGVIVLANNCTPRLIARKQDTSKDAQGSAGIGWCFARKACVLLTTASSLA